MAALLLWGSGPAQSRPLTLSPPCSGPFQDTAAEAKKVAPPCCPPAACPFCWATSWHLWLACTPHLQVPPTPPQGDSPGMLSSEGRLRPWAQTLHLPTTQPALLACLQCPHLLSQSSIQMSRPLSPASSRGPCTSQLLLCLSSFISPGPGLTVLSPSYSMPRGGVPPTPDHKAGPASPGIVPQREATQQADTPQTWGLTRVRLADLSPVQRAAKGAREPKKTFPIFPMESVEGTPCRL